MYIVYEKDGKTVKASADNKELLVHLGFDENLIQETDKDPFAIPETTENDIRVAEINARLDTLLLEAAKNDIFYKEQDQGGLDVTWKERHDEIVKERNELIAELKVIEDAGN